MKKLILIFIIIIAIAVAFYWWPKQNLPADLAAPQVLPATSEQNPQPAPAINAPKTFKFDSATDLKKELDSINPQILDSDFE